MTTKSNSKDENSGQDFNSFNFSTKDTTKKHSVTAEDEDDLNNPESLREILLQLSNEYDECKFKYNKAVNTLYEKEKVIQGLIQDANNKDEEHNLEVQIMNEEIMKLINKIQEYEIDLYGKNLKQFESRERKKMSKLVRKSVFCDKYEIYQSNENIDDECEMNYLRAELSQKEVENQNLKNDLDTKLKLNEEKYQNYINELRSDLNKFQEALNSKSEYDKILQSQICEIDETREQAEKRNQILTNQLSNLENLRKTEKFSFEQEKEKMKDEILSLKSLLEEKNIALKSFEDFTIRHQKIMKEFTALKLTLALRDTNIEKLSLEVKQMSKDLETKETEKKNLLIEYSDLKNEFADLGNYFKDNNSRLMEEFRLEKSKIIKTAECEKKELLYEMEKMNEVIENLNANIDNMKKKMSVRTFENVNQALNNNMDNSGSKFSSDKKGMGKFNSCNSEYRSKVSEAEEGTEDLDGGIVAMTLQDCLSEDEDGDDKKGGEEIQELKSQVNDCLGKLSQRDKLYIELLTQYEDMKKTFDSTLQQNMELKSCIANERFERDNEITSFRLKMKKLKEHIQKQETAYALRVSPYN